MTARYLSPERESEFPNLRRQDYQVTSDEDRVYNCIAHAANNNNAWWWPMEEEIEGVYWPAGVPREETLDAFVAAYMTEGFIPCDNPAHEAGFEKVAIYAAANGGPTHAARQLPSGLWSSKLGYWEDIEHRTLDAVNCRDYGCAVKFMKRRTATAASE